MTYRAVYKCPLCSRKLLYGNPQEIPQDRLPEVLGLVIKNQLFAGNPALHQVPMHIPCKCPDGNAGLAAFAGFIQTEPDGRPKLKEGIK